MNKAQERGQPTVGALTVPYMVNERNRPIDFKAAGLVVVSPERLGKAVYRAAKRRLDEERGIRSDSIALDIVEAVIDRLTATPDQEEPA